MFRLFHPLIRIHCGYEMAVEGWIVLVTDLQEEATVDDLMDKFGEYEEIKNLHGLVMRRYVNISLSYI